MYREIFVFSRDQEETESIRNALKSRGYEVNSRSTVPSSFRAFKGSELVLLSLGSDNIETLREIKSYHPEAVVVVADSTAEAAARAVREGAYDFLQRPIDHVKLGTAVQNAFTYMSLRSEVMNLKTTEAPHLVSPRNRKMLKVSRQIERASAMSSPLLITGEAGVGKEAIARVIHTNSSRVAGPFVTVENPAEEGEAGLFGKATSKGISHGKIVSATGGTVLVKRADTLKAELKRKFCGFIKDKKFIPVGDTEAIRADVRVICIAEHMDKKDALYKCFGSRLSIPPLRERPEDIVPLAEYFARTACGDHGTGHKRFSRDAKNYLEGHSWPGNTGELKNAVIKACLLTAEPLIERRHLASGDGSAYCSVKEFLDDKLRGYLKGMAKLGNSSLYDTVTSEFEKALLELVLKETGGNQLKASKILGLNRNTMRSKIKLYKIKNGKRP